MSSDDLDVSTLVGRECWAGLKVVVVEKSGTPGSDEDEDEDDAPKKRYRGGKTKSKPKYKPKTKKVETNGTSIVDVTNPKSTPLEMEATVKQFKIPYLPIIDTSADQRPFAMMVDLQKSFHWVLPTFAYRTKEELFKNLKLVVIDRAIEKHNQLRDQKAKEGITMLTLEDFRKKKTTRSPQQRK